MDVGTQLYMQYLQGDEYVLQKLVEMYSDGLVRFAYCFVRDSAVAEDVMEDTFATLVARRYFSPKAKFKTYLYKIARNKCIDYLRFHKRFVPLDDLQNVLSFDDVDSCVAEKERRQMLYKCMQKLPVQYRHVLQLCYLEEFSVEEICAISHKKPKQVYNLLARAKENLKSLLINEGVFV